MLRLMLAIAGVSISILAWVYPASGINDNSISSAARKIELTMKFAFTVMAAAAALPQVGKEKKRKAKAKRAPSFHPLLVS
jgi:hypothetical protein